MKPISRIGERERGYVLEVLETQFRTSLSGSMTARLEQAFAQTFGADYAISFANGTATMHAALAALGVGRGDEVIVPPLTMSATAMAALHAGATPVFADIDPHTWNIDPQSIAARIGPRTKAIIPVALYGLPADMPAIMKIAARHNLGVVEDDAQCFLGTIDGRVCGTIAHASSFSFQSSKHMTSGEGGMMTTNDAALAERIRRFANLGYAAVSPQAGGAKIRREVIQSPSYDRHSSFGFNYRMSDLCAAVALGQVERLQELVDMRLFAASQFERAIAGCSWLSPQRTPAGYRHSYWCYTVLLDPSAPISWHEFHARFSAYGGDPPYGAWKLTYLEPAFRGQKLTETQSEPYIEGLCPTAESIQPRLIQFKTNYYDPDLAIRQAAALRRTIEFFDARVTSPHQAHRYKPPCAQD